MPGAALGVLEEPGPDALSGARGLCEWAARTLPVCPPGARVLGKKRETRSGEEVNTAPGTLRDPLLCSACVFPWISSGHQPVTMRKPRPGDVR